MTALAKSKAHISGTVWRETNRCAVAHIKSKPLCVALRGAGVELRLYDLDPDAAEARARAAGYHVLQVAANKPHGLRECYLVDPDGYVWVPGIGIADSELP